MEFLDSILIQIWILCSFFPVLSWVIKHVRETVFTNDKKGEDLEVEQDNQETSFYGKSEGKKCKGKEVPSTKKNFFNHRLPGRMILNF